MGAGSFGCLTSCLLNHIMPVEPKRDPWIGFRRNSSGARVRLFCLPYAGGGSSAFRTWPDFLPPDVDLWAVQLPGREERLRDAPFTRMEPLVESLAGHLALDFDLPFALFGHSMGAIIAYELACFLRRNGLPKPMHLFVSGRRAPHVAQDRELFHQLPEPQFIEKLRELNGTPEEMFQYPELLQLVLPTLRAAFAVCETYRFRDEAVLECPVSAYGGLSYREVSHEDLEACGQITR